MGDDGEGEVLIGLGWVVEKGGDWLVVEEGRGEEGALRWRYCNASRVGLGWVVEGRGGKFERFSLRNGDAGLIHVELGFTSMAVLTSLFLPRSFRVGSVGNHIFCLVRLVLGAARCVGGEGTLEI